MSDAADQEQPPDQLAELRGTLGALEGRRLALVVTGSLSAAYLPYWLTFVHQLDLSIDLRIYLTRTATGMVSRQTVSAMADRPALIDEWEPADESSHAPHVELTSWADGFIVHPCTFSYLARLANGMGDSPTVLALQCSTAPTVLCPALPPGGLDSPAYARHLDVLRERPHVVVLPPVRGRSATTGQQDAHPPAHLPGALVALADRLQAASGAGTP